MFLTGAPARAQVVEPDGTIIPAATQLTEQSLADLFAARGEPIDVVSDARTSPSAFAPRCGFVADLVLIQTESTYIVGYHNAGGDSPPADSTLIFPKGGAPWLSLSSTDIVGDLRYTGGGIGFVLLGGQAHHWSEPSWNPACTSCKPPSPWILSLSYASKKVVGGYFVAFEDGTVGAGPSFLTGMNDGDFNDYVYFVHPACEGGGTACDTGDPGVCKHGVIQCEGAQASCKGVGAPEAEVCDGLDNDCNGSVDDGATCEGGLVCHGGTCRKKCASTEFPCVLGLTCDDEFFCVEDACAKVVCPAGEVCNSGGCARPSCAGVECKSPLVCLDGACVDALACCRGPVWACDPCAGIECPDDLVCKGGQCTKENSSPSGDPPLDGGDAVLPAPDPAPDAQASCGCGVPGSGGNAAWSLVVVALIGARSRRRRGRFA